MFNYLLNNKNIDEVHKNIDKMQKKFGWYFFFANICHVQITTQIKEYQ